MNLRPATMDDAKRLYDWRNDPVTRRNSHHSDFIPYDHHLGWLQDILRDGKCRLLIAEHERHSIGMVRLDGTDPETIVSIIVAPEARGHGLASAILELAMEHGKAWGATRFAASIKGSNVASLKAFLRAGFIADDTVWMTR